MTSIATAALIADHGYWGQDPNYPRADWKYEVANGDTLSGYWEWVVEKRDTADELDATERAGGSNG